MSNIINECFPKNHIIVGRSYEFYPLTTRVTCSWRDGSHPNGVVKSQQFVTKPVMLEKQMVAKYGVIEAWRKQENLHYAAVRCLRNHGNESRDRS